MEQFSVAEKGFGGDAAPVQAGPSGAFLFDAGDFLSQLSGADGGHVSSWPASDDDEIVIHINPEDGRLLWKGQPQGIFEDATFLFRAD
jgi:hypothetical protein